MCVCVWGRWGFGVDQGADMTIRGSNRQQASLGSAGTGLHVGEALPREVCLEPRIWGVGHNSEGEESKKAPCREGTQRWPHESR